MYRSGPSFASVVFAVWIAGGIASAVIGRVAAGAIIGSADQHLTRTEALHRYAAALALTSLVTSVVAAGIVWFILGMDGYGPTFGRAFVGVALGSAIGNVVTLYVVLDAPRPTGPAQAAPFVNAYHSLSYLPLMFVGLFVSALIIHSGSGRVPEASGETPWEYKLPPGATWRD